MKALLIGGTGTLGAALVERLLPQNQVTVFSRGELAQKQLKARFPDVKCVIGDVRDKEAVAQAMVGQDVVFLLAAIKHIDLAEQNPLEAIKTNVQGAVNVGQAALSSGVKHVVYSNTDKAVLPISTYGYTKALAQNYLLSLNGSSKTKFSAYNWGNVLGSRGSILPGFVERILKREVVPITDSRMTRFWLTIDQAADFMLANYVEAPTDRALIPPVKGAQVVRIVESIARILRVPKVQMVFTGLRGVEKYHEVLESTHEGCLRSDTCDQYTDTELDQLLEQTVKGLARGFEKTSDSWGEWGNGAEISGGVQSPRNRPAKDRPRREVAAG